MGLLLLLVVSLACFATIIVNYYTVRVLSASRAYINGESEYSKGQKEASQFLISYISTEAPTNYEHFLKAINIPMGDRVAREAMSSNLKDDSLATAGLSQGKNDLADIKDMIWLFKTFRHLPGSEEIVKIWQKADILIEQLHQKGISIHQKIISARNGVLDKKDLIYDINRTSAQLTLMQQDFSGRLGNICRQVNYCVFLINVIVTLLIIGSIILFVWLTLRNMQYAKAKIMQQNDKLQALNSELDKVIYNVSHDLRSPLAALTGLIGLIEIEDDLEQIRIFTALMQKSIDNQMGFITEIINNAKNKSIAVQNKECDLLQIIDDVLSQNNYTNNGKKLHFKKEIYIEKIQCDATRLKTILNNLISNAVKYSDPHKTDNWIKIRTFRLRTVCVIEVEDNGVGIENKDKDKIFDKFFTAKRDNNSSGIGLYLTKDAVEQINGYIKVSSHRMVGTKFTIEIPCFSTDH